MALQKQPLTINFAQGIDTKTDPKQLAAGKFTRLKDSVFNELGLLEKRNGFGNLIALPDKTSTTLATSKDTLIALGNSVRAYSSDADEWIDKGSFDPVSLSVTPVARIANTIVACDVAIAPNGLACAVFSDNLSNYYYQIIDSQTGGIVVSATKISGTIANPRVFALQDYFVIAFMRTVTAVTHLSYFAILSRNPSLVTGISDLTSAVSSINAGWDGVVAYDNLYFGWDGNDVGGAVRFTWIDSVLNQHGTTIVASENCALISLCIDFSVNSPVVWAAYYNSSNVSRAVLMDANLQSILAPTTILASSTLNGITTSSYNGVMYYYYQLHETYTHGGSRTDRINTVNITAGGTVSGVTTVMMGVGLASKAFYHIGLQRHFVLGVYAGQLQPTYFLLDIQGRILCKLAYSNAIQYAGTQVLSQINVDGNILSIGYLLATFLVPVNKAQGAKSTGVYSQFGLNLADFTIQSDSISTAEIANVLHMSGGYLWMYDGVKPVEHGFHVYPEDLAFTNADGGSSGLSKQLYYYYVVYEWTDAQGNLHRSAPSVPLKVDLTGSAFTNNIVTLYFPSLRLTYKTGNNPVRIVIYRWSTAQPIPYQITPIAGSPGPVINDPTTDQQSYADSAADSSILGNVVLYTFGGILEDIGAPACSAISIFKSRLVLLPSEDPDNIWFSKQVLEATPVEMSNELTIYTSPTLSAQGSTGKTYCLFQMDDKLCYWKRTAIYYITGSGPDNTGANDDFSDPVLITLTVGSTNPKSLVVGPAGILFQSVTKGIWLLGRDLSTHYVGADVEKYNSQTVTAALNIPNTNQIRFHLNNGIVLTYDYYVQQWATFTNTSGISGCIFQNLHTFLMPTGQLVRQETPGEYLDGSNPVLMGFTTSWLKLSGLQGFQRVYDFYLLAEYISAHKMGFQIFYDYGSYPEQQAIITPINETTFYGDDNYYGASSPYGGSTGNQESWRVYLTRQKCEAIQIAFDEMPNYQANIAPGAGLTISGINAVIGVKSGYPRLRSGANSYAG